MMSSNGPVPMVKKFDVKMNSPEGISQNPGPQKVTQPSSNTTFIVVLKLPLVSSFLPPKDVGHLLHTNLHLDCKFFWVSHIRLSKFWVSPPPPHRPPTGLANFGYHTSGSANLWVSHIRLTKFWVSHIRLSKFCVCVSAVGV